ncbi:MAG TPA: sigma-70 family RNA polymerase sigma factor [Gemmatimonadaceae bacterium]|nr:sigma-70 family RNA polymerase sigma factor [Gemmatimonadaceae bacterium]
MTSTLAATSVSDPKPAADDLVARARQGDVRAFESLYRAHGQAVYALALRLLGDDAAAREQVQDIFVHAWERLGSFRGDSAFATWLHRLGVNLTLERLRAERRDAGRFVDDDADDLPARAPTGDDVHARIDLDAALARLPTGARMVFLLHDVEGYTHEEIARLTGMAPGTARAQLFKARRRLMALLEG